MSAGLFEKGPGTPVSSYALAQSKKDKRAVLRRIVDRVGFDAAVAACGLSDSHLNAALAMKPGRNLDDHHIDALLALGTDQERCEYLDAQQAPFGRCSQIRKIRTDTERLRDLEFKVAARFGEAGVELVEAERSRP